MEDYELTSSSSEDYGDEISGSSSEDDTEEVPVPNWPLQLITVRLMNGEKIYLTAHHFKTLISTIKDQIEAQTRTSMKDNCLVYVGKVLDEGLTLSDYKVRASCHTIDVHSKDDTSK